MSNAEDLLDRVRKTKNDIHRASFENRDKRITTEDHGHGYISLNIPAARKHRKRHLDRLEQKDQAARTSD